LSLSRTFNGYGEQDGSAMTVNNVPAGSYTLTRNKAGRITSKTTTLNGTTTEFSYTYDDLGRLKTVTKDGTLVESYEHGPNGTRTSEMNLLRGIPSRSFTYSEEDHLLTAGDTTYEYDLDGFLTTKTQGSQVTRYVYSSRGELLSVTLPDGRLIEYVHDPLGRRIAKKIDGAVTEKYLWQGMTRLLAVYDANDNLVQRFQYADGRMPVAMTQSGATYYLAHDQVGSLNLVTDATGAVVKQIDYDSFGNILSETNASFGIPFGFAGGLFDQDTGLIRFGFRDYDPDVGRWTAKDPIFFAGGDTNLYGAVQADPVNRVDPFGLFDWGYPIRYWGDFGGGVGDFISNYRDMRKANTIGSDKYFHCMANCQASRRGLGGRDAAELISETRELFDEYVKRDPPSACNEDRSANRQGREGNPQDSCKDTCSSNSLRPPWLDPRW